MGKSEHTYKQYYYTVLVKESTMNELGEIDSKMERYKNVPDSKKAKVLRTERSDFARDANWRWITSLHSFQFCSHVVAEISIFN